MRTTSCRTFRTPLYEWEAVDQEKLQSAADYTARSQAFLSLARLIHQVATDYDILVDSITRLNEEYKWFDENIAQPRRALERVNDGRRPSWVGNADLETRKALGDVSGQLVNEVKLIKTYNNLYLQRSQIGVNECFAMVNQRDADVMHFPFVHEIFH